MTLARELARRITNTKYDDLTPGALRYAKIGLLDTLGVAIAGAQEDAAVISRRIAGQARGVALVWGTQRRAEPTEAAFLNGIAANVLDFDDCTDNLGGHPSAPVLPALFALAEKLGASGRDVLTAYVVGFETETQLGRGVNFHHYEKGWHPTATLGVFGAGAASAHLLGLDEERTTQVLALCASMAAGLKSNLGSMGKPLHVGSCSRNGLLAALLACEGFTGNADALEHHHGFLEVFNGAGTYSVQRILAKWGAPWDIEIPGIAIKQYPCCLSTQSAVDLALDLVRTHDVKSEQVTRIVSRTSQRRLEHTNRPQPRSALDAKLSIQYVLARAVTDRRIALDHFEGDAFKSPHVQHVMQRVNALPFDAGGPAPDMGATMTIELDDGRSVSGTIDHPVGHAVGKPLDPRLLAAKFYSCASPTLADEQIDRIADTIDRFERIDDLRTLTAMLEPIS
ncbi:MAG: MmgE/PrpD family protein [Burkholderiales bacterium]